MKVLFIGGTGVISSACSELAIQQGIELYLLNRGKSIRPMAKGAIHLEADIRQPASAIAAIGNITFDAVVEWMAFTPEQLTSDIRLFRGRTRQYLFISSASAYQKPPGFLPITESTPLYNPFIQYSRDKATCEALLERAWLEESFPFTVVRPSHTYDKTMLPFHGGYTTVARMRLGKPVVVHGDGTSLWTMTHHRDFAVGLVGLLGNPHAIGQTFHITSDESLSWNQIYTLMGQAAGVEAQLVHVPSEVIARYDAQWGASLLGDKAHSMVFDNSRIRSLVPQFHPVIPFWQGAREIIAWYDEDPSRQVIDAHNDAVQDQLIEAMNRLEPN
ncbi:MAG TPA: SDR family oxidoreductase [Anaerolineales bacterium]|nr:SDR family oxidoreductase [Anaerolineales bacterium]